MRRTLSLLLLLLIRAYRLHAVIILTSENFWKQVLGKNVFIFFSAEWCSHCENLVPIWTRLADHFQDKEDLVIAKVDCDETQDVCEFFDVEFFPTLLYGDPQHAEVYSGDHEYETLQKFTEEYLLELYCSIHNLDACDQEEISAIKGLREKPLQELKDIRQEVEQEAYEFEAIFQAEVEEIQQKYQTLVDDYNEKIDKLREKNHYKFVAAILQELEGDDLTGGEL